MIKTILSRSIFNLSKYLFDYHQKFGYSKQTIILIDEYDNYLLHSFRKPIFSKILMFLFSFFGQSLKDNKFLFFSIVIGICPIVKSDLISNFNNFVHYSIDDEQYCTYFGFIEQEVQNSLEYFNLLNFNYLVKFWYNGYLFGNNIIYNPFSICNFLNQKTIKSYWTETDTY